MDAPEVRKRAGSPAAAGLGSMSYSQQPEFVDVLCKSAAGMKDASCRTQARMRNPFRRDLVLLHPSEKLAEDVKSR